MAIRGVITGKHVLLNAATSEAKIVLTSRTQHFKSHEQITVTLGRLLSTMGVVRVLELQDFGEPEIRGYLVKHFDGFTAGNIQLKDLVYYTSLILIALFLTVRSIETRRWR